MLSLHYHQIPNCQAALYEQGKIYHVGSFGVTCAMPAVGIPDVPVILDRGNDYHGISHLWRDHKDIFANPDEAVKILKDTLGNSNCRVVVSLERIISTKFIKNKKTKSIEVLKRIVLTTPEADKYCVLVFDENKKILKLVSWHNGSFDYGNSKWTLGKK